jgi:UDP-N-acetylglucosamine 2-epimerase (non-hydrolysing)
MLICTVVGARPNFMKIGPIVLELNRRAIPGLLVHTGQHYDANMSHVFWQDLELPPPDVSLGIGSGTHARQTAAVMIAFEEVCLQHHPDLVVVGGDVNSTLGAALAAVKLTIPVAHVEAGLRSGDRSMPEEINRIVTDHVSELLFTTESSANLNLEREGIPQDHIHFTGNCMVDSLMKHAAVGRGRSPWRVFDLEERAYALVTLHRPGNVEDPRTLALLVESINGVSELLPVLFPIHPRTRERLQECGCALAPGVQLCEPLPYLTFVGLMGGARCVLTDSGGIQEETTVLGVPCLTLRANTERPVTVALGTNRLVARDPRRIYESVEIILDGSWPTGTLPPLWDGQAARRVVDAIEEWAARRTDIIAEPLKSSA